MQKIALYTAVTGGYEVRSEILSSTVAMSTPTDGVGCFRFADSPDSSGGLERHHGGFRWREVQDDPRVPGDPIRSARALKILGHPLLSSYDVTVWVDNRVRLKIGPAELVERFLPPGADLAVPTHCHRASLADEFDAVLDARLEDPRRVREQRSAYTRQGPSLLAQPVPWTAILIRRNTPAVRRFNSVWWEQVLRYSRRDQLSFSYAQQMVSDVRVVRFPVNNFDSDIHEWRKWSDVKRRAGAGQWRPEDLRTEFAEIARFVGAGFSRRFRFRFRR